MLVCNQNAIIGLVDATGSILEITLEVIDLFGLLYGIDCQFIRAQTITHSYKLEMIHLYMLSS